MSNMLTKQEMIDRILHLLHMIHESFLQIGGQYEEWHKAGKRKELETPNSG